LEYYADRSLFHSNDRFAMSGDIIKFTNGEFKDHIFGLYYFFGMWNVCDVSTTYENEKATKALIVEDKHIKNAILIKNWKEGNYEYLYAGKKNAIKGYVDYLFEDIDDSLDRMERSAQKSDESLRWTILIIIMIIIALSLPLLNNIQ
jgi:hypothetical protein